MQTVILAVAETPEMDPLTVNKPKALVKIHNIPLIEHLLNHLNGQVKEVRVVVGSGREIIEKTVTRRHRGLTISYLDCPDGTGDLESLSRVANELDDQFLLLNLSGLISREDIKKCLKETPALLVSKSVSKGEKRRTFCGCVTIRKRQLPANPSGTAGWDQSIGEFIFGLSEQEPFAKITASDYLPITYSWDLLAASHKLFTGLKSRIDGTVEAQATIHGPVVIGKETIVRNGVYIEGPVLIGSGSNIGPNCYIRANTSIGSECRVGNAVEIKQSIIGDRSKVGHLSYLGDSILGNDVNIGAGNISANLRHDYQPMETVLHGERINTNLKKLGIIVGDGVHTGINNSFYPGRKIWPGIGTLPGELITRDRTE